MNLPVACTLTAAGRARREAAIRALFSRADVHGTPDGLEARLEGTAENLRQIAELAAIERECCRFLRFEVTAEPDLGPIRLRITGPPGTAEFLRDWIPG